MGADETSEILLKRFVAGDARAWAALVARHSPKLHAFVAHGLRMRRCQQTEHLTLDIWTEVALSAPSFTGESFKAWLFGIARHLVLKARQTRKRGPRMEPLEGADGEPRTDCAVEDGEDLAKDEACKAAWGALDELEEEEREILLLHKVQGLSLDQIEGLKGIDRSRVCRIVAKALSKLRHELRAHDPERDEEPSS